MTAVAFVAGATGFVGRAVVTALRGRGVRTIAHVRPDSATLTQWRDRFSAEGAEVDTTAWQLDALIATLRSSAVTHIFVLIGTTRSRARAARIPGDIYETVDVALTRMLAEAATATGTRPRLVYLSSIGASETASSKYLRARGRAESAVRNADVSWMIARPSIITGPDRDDARPSERIAATAADAALKLVSLLGRSRGRAVQANYASTTPETLAGSLVRHALDDANSRVFEGADLR